MALRNVITIDVRFERNWDLVGHRRVPRVAPLRPPSLDDLISSSPSFLAKMSHGRGRKRGRTTHRYPITSINFADVVVNLLPPLMDVIIHGKTRKRGIVTVPLPDSFGNLSLSICSNTVNSLMLDVIYLKRETREREREWKEGLLNHTLYPKSRCFYPYSLPRD